MSADAETLAVYAGRAADYAGLGLPPGALGDLDAFLAVLPARPRILDLGCGPGLMAAEMARRGATVAAWDASPAMAAMAGAHPGVSARVAAFDDLDAVAAYHGIWASFSLLHSPRAALPGHLARIRRALVPRGALYLGMKTGAGEGRDSLGRYYAYHTAAELLGKLRRAGFRPRIVARGRSLGLAGRPEPFVALIGHG